MRKLIYLGMSVALLATAASCTLNRLEEPAASGKDGTQITFTATVPDEAPGTKTMLVDGGPDLYWAPNDEILIYSRLWGISGFVSQNAEPSNIADFGGSVYGAAGDVSVENQVWAVYPLDWRDVTFNDGKSVTAILPFSQRAASGTFDPKALLLAARSASMELAFYHVGGGLKFKLTQDWIQQVEFRANDGTPLAGKVTFVFDEEGHPAVTTIEEAEDAILLTAPRGETFRTDTWYYMACLPAVLEQGYTLTFRSRDKTGVVVHDGQVEVKRATWGTLESADAGVVPEDAVNLWDEIRYTTTDESVVEPNNRDSFGKNVTMLSNKYEGGEGVIVFDGVVTDIPEWAFQSKGNLKSVTLPNSVRKIGQYAFCYNNNTLEAVDLPEGVRQIGNYAFGYDYQLQEINIPGSVEEIGQNVFLGCDCLMKFTGPYASADGRCLILDGVLLSFARSGLEYPVEYVIPEGVKTLSDRVFQNCYQFTSVTLPASVEVVGTAVFASCGNLASFQGKFASEDGRFLVKDGAIVASALSGVSELVIPGNVETIEKQAFAQCYNLQKLIVSEGVKKIADEAFTNCGNLREITLPESLEEFGNNVFRGVRNIVSFSGKGAAGNGEYLVIDGTLLAVAGFNDLADVTIPAGVTKIAPYLFENSGITSVVIPEGVTEIGENAFYWCRNLTSVTLPESLKKIGNLAFCACQNESFTSFTIPAGVSEVGYEILSSCNNLTSITVLPSTPPVAPQRYRAIGWFNVDPVIYVPAASLQAYQKADGWRNQSNYQPIPE